MKYNLYVLVHLFVNAAVFAICFKRLELMHDALQRVKLGYVIMLVLSVANGLSPIFFEQWPTPVSIVYASGVLYVMYSDKYQWKNGLPPSARSDFAQLSEVELSTRNKES